MLVLVRPNLDSGRLYRIDESTGQQLECNVLGNLVKPFEPRITGRYNYEERKHMLEKTGADLGPVELPTTLRPNFRRNYIPQNQHLEGYA